MDFGDITQVVLVATVAFTLGRVGLALARLIERRAAALPALPSAAEDRLQRLEDECSSLRQDVVEMQERQDFTERALLRDPTPPRSPPADSEEDVLTPR
jgi:hypothetical protein